MGVRLQNILTGEYLERSEVNWKNLDTKSKEQYRVLGEKEAIEAKSVYIPPELEAAEAQKANQEAALKEVEAQKKAEAELIAKREAEEKAKADEAANANKPETDEEKVIRLHKAGGDKKDIATATGLHHKKVEGIINAFKKSEAK